MRRVRRLLLVFAIVVAIVNYVRSGLPARASDNSVLRAEPLSQDAGRPSIAMDSDWSAPHWEPFKIALGTLYALCLQSGFDSTVDYFKDHPASLRSLHTDFSPTGPAALVIVLLCAYVVWISLFFLYNARLYMLLPSRASRARITAYASLTLSFGAFYLFGATLGPPSRIQVFAICAVIAADTVFPLHLGLVTHTRARVWWMIRDVGQLGIAVAILVRVPDDQLRRPMWVYLLLGLLLIQLFIAPQEYRRQLKAEILRPT